MMPWPVTGPGTWEGLTEEGSPAHLRAFPDSHLTPPLLQLSGVLKTRTAKRRSPTFGPALRCLSKDRDSTTDRSRGRKGSAFGPDLVFRLMVTAGWEQRAAPHPAGAASVFCAWTGALVSVSFLFDCRAWLGSPPNFWGEYSFSHPQKDPPVGCEMSISRKHKKLLVIKMPGDYSDELHSNLLSSFHNLRKL